MLKKSFIVSCGLLFSAHVNASGYSGQSQIVRFSSFSGSPGTFEIQGNWNNVDKCPNAAKWIVGQSATTQAELNALYSTVLAAYMAKSTIELYVTGCNANGQPMVKSIYVPNRT